MKNLLPSYGCSQEDHIKNCGHFGYTGKYLSNHDIDCDHRVKSKYECTCNPEARAKTVILDTIHPQDKRLLNKNEYEQAVLALKVLQVEKGWPIPTKYHDIIRRALHLALEVSGE